MIQVDLDRRITMEQVCQHSFIQTNLPEYLKKLHLQPTHGTKENLGDDKIPTSEVSDETSPIDPSVITQVLSIVQTAMTTEFPLSSVLNLEFVQTAVQQQGNYNHDEQQQDEIEQDNVDDCRRLVEDVWFCYQVLIDENDAAARAKEISRLSYYYNLAASRLSSMFSGSR